MKSTVLNSNILDMIHTLIKIKRKAKIKEKQLK